MPSLKHKTPAILTPVVDGTLIGGASILFFVPFLFLAEPQINVLQETRLCEGTQFLDQCSLLVVLVLLFNLPHFMASYVTLYQSPRVFQRFPWASLYFPAILICCGAFALWKSPETPTYIVAMHWAGSIYLARHYTGQVWGMMATYAHLAGRPFDNRERRLARGGLNLLMCWHVSWFFFVTPDLPEWARNLIVPTYTVLTILSLAALGLGIAAFTLYFRRHRKAPPVRTLLAWIAIFLWYAAMAKDPRAILWVQIAHALQYLLFPLRVNMNRYKRENHPSKSRALLHVTMIGAALIVAGITFDWMFTEKAGWATNWVGSLLGETAAFVYLPIAAYAVLNIHHYFVDGCIWKVSNPETRKDLFAHLPPKK